MWIRRSEEEIQSYLNGQEAKRKSLLRPFLFALALTLGALILYLVGYRGGSLRVGIVMLSDPGSLTLGTVGVSVFLFVIFFAVHTSLAEQENVFIQRRFVMSSM